MVTLIEVKQFLNIDFDDHDDVLSSLLAGEIKRAERITGRNYTDKDANDYEVMSRNVANAVIRAVATNFNQGDDLAVDGSGSESVNASIYVYRSECKSPIFG